MPRGVFVPARVIIVMPTPVPCPIDAVKFVDSTRISWIMSVFGEVDICRPTPLLVAPSIDQSTPPTPPSGVALVVGPPTNPWPANGMTPLAIMPGANRANSTGMFDCTGSSVDLLLVEDQSLPQRGHLQQRRLAGHGNFFGDRADFERELQRELLARAERDPASPQRLEALHLDDDFVIAGDEQPRLEVAACVGRELLRDAGSGVGDLHSRARG